jgi:hypothetical protein
MLGWLYHFNKFSERAVFLVGGDACFYRFAWDSEWDEDDPSSEPMLRHIDSCDPVTLISERFDVEGEFVVLLKWLGLKLLLWAHGVDILVMEIS